ncbi:hypothetical protein JXA63_00855 [Candidatus Woesebacteria bacterium]|nr:hypothetical protein [Candidatus Woesebacteria bacterium]
MECIKWLRERFFKGIREVNEDSGEKAFGRLPENIQADLTSANVEDRIKAANWLAEQELTGKISRGTGSAQSFAADVIAQRELSSKNTKS